MKFIKLLTAARVMGTLRHPHEGVLHLDDADAQRLIDEGAGEDVSADFSADQRKDVPVEAIVNATAPANATSGHPHQSEVGTSSADVPEAPARQKRAATKE